MINYVVSRKEKVNIMKKQMKDKNNTQKINNTWLWKYIIDNRLFSVLFIIFLTILTLFLFTKIAYVFAPIKMIFSIVGPPVVFSILIYYLLIPLVRFFERKGIPTKGAIALVFMGILFLVSGAIHYMIPTIRTQINELVTNFPMIWKTVSTETEQLLQSEWLNEIYQELQLANLFADLSNRLSNLVTVTVGSIGNIVGYITKISVTLVTIPFVLYYLLAEGSSYKINMIQKTPTRLRPVVSRFLNESSFQVGSYVRGELLVAVGVSILFYIGYSIIGLDYALLLSVTAGLLNLVPYLGSIMSAVPAMILGAFISPVKLIQVILVLIVEQTIEGRIISPQILGNKLDLHPLIILFILLVSGSLFGFMGLVLAVPGFGVLRVIWNMFFDWMKEKYNLYEETE